MKKVLQYITGPVVQRLLIRIIIIIIIGGRFVVAGLNNVDDIFRQKLITISS